MSAIVVVSDKTRSDHRWGIAWSAMHAVSLSGNRLKMVSCKVDGKQNLKKEQKFVISTRIVPFRIMLYFSIGTIFTDSDGSVGISSFERVKLG